MLLQLLNFLRLPGRLQQEWILNACCGAGSQLTPTPAPSLQPDTATPCAAACIAAGRLRQLLIFLCLPSLLQHM